MFLGPWSKGLDETNVIGNSQRGSFFFFFTEKQGQTVNVKKCRAISLGQHRRKLILEVKYGFQQDRNDQGEGVWIQK